MAPKKRKRLQVVTKKKKKKGQRPPSIDPEGMFRGMVVFLIEKGVQPRRLQIWKQKLVQMGAAVGSRLTKTVTHIFSMDSRVLAQELGHEWLRKFKGNILLYEWLENSLKSGERLSEGPYALNIGLEGASRIGNPLTAVHSGPLNGSPSDDSPHLKRPRILSEDSIVADTVVTEEDRKTGDTDSCLTGPEQRRVDVFAGDATQTAKEESANPFCAQDSSCAANSSVDASYASKSLSLTYNPPDLNQNITEIFGKLIDIYRALGDDRRSFSYYKAIPVIEKLPFKIESADQVKHLPAIGRSLQDHIHEIVTTGKLSKLEHFENDEKVRTVTLFGEVWGIGPVAALKLYEKGYRTLDDLKNEDSLSHAQKLGLKYFDDIKKRIPRHEVKDMEILVQKAGEAILPGVVIVCGGSYRRGKASCGDLDIIITHPDGQSHKGFLPKYVQYLKDIKFLREDLVFSTHSMEGTDSGADTYFGLCTYPGREQRHRIDLKVYPWAIYAFGLVAWTGNDVLNRRLRLLAESKGYRLDDTGLFLAAQGSSGKPGVRSSVSMSCKTEREVFDLLGFPWLEPHERNL